MLNQTLGQGEGCQTTVEVDLNQDLQMEDPQEEILETDQIGLLLLNKDIIIILLQIFLVRLLDLGVHRGTKGV